MKLFVIMIGIATAIGGFVGGRITDSTFSFLGSLVGGVGLIICILSLGAYFQYQEERKRKESLPPELREVFDRWTGKKPLISKSRWTPRPFFENKSKDDFKEWFAHVEPWNRLDFRLMDILIEKLYTNPMFEVFVHTSQDHNLVPKFIPLQALFDKGVGEVSIFPHIASILYEAALKNRDSVRQIISSKQLNDSELKKQYGLAMDAFESSLLLEPNFYPSYLQLAILKYLIGNKGDAIKFCNQGLETIARMKQAPFQKTNIPSIQNANLEFDKVEAQLKSLLGKLVV